ncbi:MAG: hypothetical protein WC852_00990 [Candidatus Nanoarchaeia archaeon]|jgi:Txe/YoeB family toxin of Txe-Axe toxin-antitoxin module
MKKPVRIILIEDAQASYNELCVIVEKQLNTGKQQSEEIQLLRSINQKVDFLKANPFYGNNILKRNIPSSYNVQNLWRVELSQFWRMLYTIKGDKIEIICFILDILSHKEYDKKFGYKKK